MHIGIVGYKLDGEKYYNITQECISSVYYDSNKVAVILHKTSEEIASKLRDKFPGVAIINDPPWKNNLSAAWNYILGTFFVYHDFAAILGNDVIVSDGKFSWFDEHKYRDRGFVSAVDLAGQPEYQFGAFVMFKWLYNKIGEFDIKMPFQGMDHDYQARLKLYGKDIHGDLCYYSEKKFVIDHRRSFTLNDLRYSEENTPGHDFYEEEKKVRDHYIKKMNEYKAKGVL